MANYTEHITQTLTITDTVNPVYQHIVGQGGVLDVLQMVQFTIISLERSPKNQSVTHSIVVTPTCFHSTVKSDSNTVKVDQTIQVNLSSARTIAQTLEFQEFIIARLDKNYHYIPPSVPLVLPPPQTINPTPPSIFLNTVNIDSPVFTISKGDDILELRLPKFGDKDKYEATRIKRNTRGGVLIIYRDPRWPEREILSVEFEWLTVTQIGSLLTFMHTYLGQKIHLKDQFAREFDGYIITPEAEVAQPKRNGYSAKFDFQIYQVPPT